MQTGSISLVRLCSSSQNWSGDRSERRERRSGYRRRDEDVTLIDEGAGPTPNQVGPSLGFLTQVAAQTLPAPATPTGVYKAARWRCGVCADERA